jgi:ribosomal protein S18 acetylase RimI-like enzyme
MANELSDITISRTSDEDIDEFSAREWTKLNRKHYGTDIPWSEWSPSYFTFKATKNGEIIGSASGYLLAGVAFITKLIIKEELRDRGIGGQLLKYVENYSKEAGAHKIMLETGVGWRANDFYRQRGYKRLGIIPDHFRRRDFVMYQKGLA